MISRIASRLRVFNSSFRHDRAQKYELKYALNLIRTDFPEVFKKWESARSRGSLWQSADDQWFCGNDKLWNSFVNYVKDRKCLEIGSGPFGYLALFPEIRDRVIIEPLVDEFRKCQLETLGSTFFSEDIFTIAKPAEELVVEIESKIDGFIVCRNALDHCEDPLTVLYNISRYAASGCYLLLWTDIWHLVHPDEGHHNITKSGNVLDALLSGLGFDIIQEGQKIRDQAELIEYGRLARKR